MRFIVPKKNIKSKSKKLSSLPSKVARKFLSRSKFDLVKWILVWLILIIGIVANDYFSAAAWAWRAAAGIVLCSVVLIITAHTSRGQTAWNFIKGARTELYRMVWPTRAETIQTTLVVVTMVLVTAVILWGIDSIFLWGVIWLTT